MLRQAQSKISVSMPGSGVKCFRSTESPVNAVPAMMEDDMAWSYPWLHGVNCVRLDRMNLFGDLFNATQREDLHAIYIGAQETIELYRSRRYVAEYIIPNIQARL